MCNTNHSKLKRLIKVNLLKTLDLRVNDYTIYDENGRASNYRVFERCRTMSSRVFSQSLRLIFGAYMLEANKHETWKQL